MSTPYPPWTKVEFCRRLGDTWKDLADLIGVMRHERARFERGDEARAIWEWLEDRGRLGELGTALHALGREDLAELLPAAAVAEPVPAEAPLRSAAEPDSSWRLADDPDLDTFWWPRARGAEPSAGDGGWRFRGRRRAIDRIAEHLKDAAVRPAPLVVVGEPGSGKSALLAHVLVLADPRLREQMPERYRGPETARLVGAVDVAVRATGATLPSVCAALSRAAGLPADTAPERLMVELPRHPGGFRVVVDGLDEAAPGQVGPIAGLLRALARSPRVRVVASIRRAPERSSLDEVRRVALAAAPESTIEADQAPYLELADVVDVVQEGLEQQWSLPSPYAGRPRLAGRVAAAVATRSRGNFLVATMTSHNLATDHAPVDVTRRRWWAEFPSDVEGAMDAYIARFGDDERQREVRELLMPLAFALGEGLPTGSLWASAASALCERAYAPGDVHRIVDDAATYMVVHVAGSRRTYRLFHDALAQYLRARCRRDDPATDLVGAWRAGVDQGSWATADQYLLRHLAEHATGTQLLDGLLQDVVFVVAAEPAGLIPALAHADSPAAARVARAYRQLPSTAGGPALRAAALTLAAQQVGDAELRDRFAASWPGLPWRAVGGAWRPPDDHTVVLWLEPDATATALLPHLDGSAVLVSGDSAGRLWVHEVVDGIGRLSAGYDVHAPEVAVVAVGGSAAQEGRHLVCSAGSDGSVRLWHLDTGLLVPLGAEIAATTGAPVHVACTPTAVALCDAAGAVRLLTVGEDGGVKDTAGELPGVRHVAVVDDGSGPAVLAGTVDGVVLELRPDGQGALAATALPIRGRWTAGAIATTPVAGGELVAIGTGGRELHLLRLAGGAVEPLGVSTGVAYAGISALAFSPATAGSPAGLLLGDHDGWVRFWALDGGDLHPRRIGRPHLREVSGLCVVATPAGPFGVSVDAGGRVAMWPLEGSDPAEQRQRDVDLAGAGVWSLVLREDRRVEGWTVDEENRLVLESALDPVDGAVLYTVDLAGRSRRYRSDLAAEPAERESTRRMVPLHPYRALAVGTVADGEQVALALRGDGAIEVHGRDLGRRPETIHTGRPDVVAVSLDPGPAGKPAVTWGDTDGVVRLRPWAEHAQAWCDTPARDVGRADVRTSVAGDVALSGDGVGEVVLWSVTSAGQHLDTFRPGTASITAVALDPDRFAVTGDRNGTLLITPVRGRRFRPAAAHRIELGAAVLSVAVVARHTVLVWCRPGAVVLTWDPSIDPGPEAS